MSRIKADPGAGLQGNSLSCLSQCWVSALTAALILSQKPQELFSKSCRKTSCFSCEAVQCFFTKDIHFESWKVTKLVPNCKVRPKTFQSSQCFNVAFLAAAKKCFWLMLRRAAPVSCCTTDLLVTRGESFAFCACFPTGHVSVFPWQGLICWVLMHPWTGTLSTVFFCVSLLRNCWSSEHKGHEVLVPTCALVVTLSVALETSTLYFSLPVK